MSIIERVRQLQLPPDEFVVIGSGVLDALELRASDDIDLAVSNTLFDQLKQRGWQSQYKEGEEYLIDGQAEAWHGWSGGPPHHTFDELYEASLVVDGIHFANPKFVIGWKRGRGTPKDLTDIQLLEEYLAYER